MNKKLPDGHFMGGPLTERKIAHAINTLGDELLHTFRCALKGRRFYRRTTTTGGKNAVMTEPDLQRALHTFLNLDELLLRITGKDPELYEKAIDISEGIQHAADRKI